MFKLPTEYDVIVVGSGHAGIEAALASARLGCRTLMLTQNLDTIGQMSCNPAIGGLAKGQIVREIDALGGAMGLNADATGIQFRMLNRSKGPSVRAPRVQCDKKAYQFRMKAILERTPNLDLKQANVSRVLVADGSTVGVETDLGLTVRGSNVVVTSGTFLRGLLHLGSSSQPGGRMADASSSLSENLHELGFEIGRFKTGTPCRISRRSIDFAKCKIQPGDEPPPRFSFFGDESYDIQDVFTLNDVSNTSFHVEQLPCWITQTNARTHEIIRRNLSRSPLYAGRIKGTGPRYCPSIEDKVVKFADREAHQLFLEPEGRHTEEFYVNGISTSLPYEVQLEFVRSIPALERAEIMRPGYAVDIDDLVSKGTDEPYRMFTSRAEDRLQLRHDNADQRLTTIGHRLGLVSPARWTAFQAKMSLVRECLAVANNTRCGGVSISQLLKRPAFTYLNLQPNIRAVAPADIWELVEADIKYEGYAARQAQHNKELSKRSSQKISDGFDFASVAGLSSETRQKLSKVHPTTLGQAARISGVTPADISILSIWLAKSILQHDASASIVETVAK